MRTHIEGREVARRAVELLGGPVQAARRLSVPGHRYQVVQSWLKTRVPAEYCPLIERETGGDIRCEHLRPDVAWAVLRAATQTAEEAPGTRPRPEAGNAVLQAGGAGEEAVDFVRALLAAGLTQEQIAARAGLLQGQVSKILRGRVRDVMSRNYRRLQELHAECCAAAPPPQAPSGPRESAIDNGSDLHAANRAA